MYEQTSMKMAAIDWTEIDWQSELANNITSISSLQQYLPLSAVEKESLSAVEARHPMNVPRYYLDQIDPNDPDDPIRKLAIPSADELILAGDMGETDGRPLR